ncbi:MAG TPA: TonB-dependent receptor, partial [Vicinamibacterales bacterium]|nr:TonB-dependent receptor [Vicinamibacterales bacterium]
EKVRSAVTDGSGQYRIVDLRPGTYSVTFSLPGFATVRREGIELEGAFVATVNAELRVGALEETITVTGESPLVDVQSSRTTQTMDKELLAAIPSGRQYWSYTALVPALNIQGSDVGGVAPSNFSVFQAHGGRRNEGQVLIDGLSMGWLGMGVSSYVPEVTTAEEVTFTLMGALGEAATGGPQMNIVPRTGGNRFSGTYFTAYAGDGWQSNNLTAEHRAAGLRATGQLLRSWDVNGAFGGPIKRDALWFFATGRHQGNRSLVAGIWVNKNAGNPNAWHYEPDYGRQAKDDGTWKNGSIRVTWQATPRNKFSVWWDEQVNCQSCINSGVAGGPSATFTTTARAPEADGRFYNPIRMAQATWNSPLTNRVLLEASFGLGPRAQFGDKERPDTNKDLIPVTDSGTVPGPITNITYRSLPSWARNYGEMFTYRGSLSYITGAHNMKVGAQLQTTRAAFVTYYNNRRLLYTFNSGVPVSLTMYANHAANNPFEMDTTALYAQDVWTVGRLTLQGGVRWEYLTSYYPESRFARDVFLPVELTFPAQEGDVGPKDINPRFGAAYDLFGNGKTAVKFSLGRFPTAENSYGVYGWQQQPAFRVATSTTRAWNDANRNFEPDCDLLNMAANGECGPGNPNFGRQVVFATYDPKILKGWNIREYSWDLSAGIQHEVLPRVALEVLYVRRSWGNQTITDNLAYSAADYDRFSLTAPSHPLLPGGGGYRVDGFYELKADRPFGLIDNFITHQKNYGDVTETYNGVDITVSARTRVGLTVQGGASIGRQAFDNCDVLRELPEARTIGPVRQPEAFCDYETPYHTNLKGLATYTVPRIDVQVAGTWSSRPFVGTNFPTIASQSLTATWIVTNAQVVPALGRPLSGNQAVALVNIVEPGILYGDRINQLDFRVAKLFRYGRTRTNVSFDLFNVTNASPVTTYNTTFAGAGATWLQPTSILAGRVSKVSVQFDW